MVTELARYFKTREKPPSELGNLGDEKFRAEIAREWAVLEGDNPFAQLEIYRAAGLLDEAKSLGRSAMRALQDKTAMGHVHDADQKYTLAINSMVYADDSEGLQELGNIALMLAEIEGSQRWLEGALKIYGMTSSEVILDGAFKIACEEAETNPEALGWFYSAVDIAKSAEDASKWSRLGRLLIDLKTNGVPVKYGDAVEVSNHVQEDGLAAALKYMRGELRAELATYFTQNFDEVLQRLAFRRIDSVKSGIQNLQSLVKNGRTAFTSGDYATGWRDGDGLTILRVPTPNAVIPYNGLEVYFVTKQEVRRVVADRRGGLHLKPAYSGEGAFNYLMQTLESNRLF